VEGIKSVKREGGERKWSNVDGTGRRFGLERKKEERRWVQ
jgi:hypothetical protein